MLCRHYTKIQPRISSRGAKVLVFGAQQRLTSEAKPSSEIQSSAENTFFLYGQKYHFRFRNSKIIFITFFIRGTKRQLLVYRNVHIYNFIRIFLKHLLMIKMSYWRINHIKFEFVGLPVTNLRCGGKYRSLLSVRIDRVKFWAVLFLIGFECNAFLYSSFVLN